MFMDSAEGLDPQTDRQKQIVVYVAAHERLLV